MLTLAVSNSAAAQELSVNWFGGAGNWSNASDWGGCLNGNPCVPNNSGNLTYDVSLPAFVNGYEVFEDVQFVQVNKLSVGVCINNIDLNINSGSELVLLSGNSYNYCILQNAGTLNVFNNTIGTLSTVTNDSGAYLGNAGTLLILGRVNNTFGTLQNSGLTTIFGGPQLPNGAYGILNNYSPFSGSQSLGGILNTGTIKNFGVFNNTTTANFPAEINNSTGGTIENGYLTNQNVPGNLNNNANSILNNNVGATLNNNALSVLNNYGIVNNAGTFYNAPSATLNNMGAWNNTGTITNLGGLNNATIQGAGTISIGGGNSFTNHATMNANQSNPLTIEPNGGSFTNTGTLEATNGSTLALNGGAIGNIGGTIHADPGSTVQLQNGIAINGGTLTTSGTGTIQPTCCGNYGTFNGVTNSGTLKLIQTSEFLQGTVTNNGSFQVISNGTDTELDVIGSVTLAGNGTVTMVNTSNVENTYIMGYSQASGASLTNQSTIEGSGLIGSGFGLGTGNSFINQGTINANVSAGSLVIWVSTGSFTNIGTLSVKKRSILFIPGGGFTNFAVGTGTLTGGKYIVSGTLGFDSANILTNAATITLVGPSSEIINTLNNSNALSNLGLNSKAGSLSLLSGSTIITSGNVTNAGKLTVGAGSSFQSGTYPNGRYTQTLGTTTVDGTFSALTGMDIQAGMLFGVGTITSAVQSSGTVTPGNSTTKPGTLSINGSYVQNSAGALNILIGGLNVGTQYGQLLVTNGVNLNGALNIKRIKGFVPAVGNTFTIATGSAIGGTFSKANGLSINSSEHFQLSYNAASVTLTVVPGP